MLQADVLVDVVGTCVDREWWWGGLTQDLDLAVADLDLTGRQPFVEPCPRDADARHP